MRDSPVKAQIELKVEALVNSSEYSEKVIAAITNVIDKSYQSSDMKTELSLDLLEVHH